MSEKPMSAAAVTVPKDKFRFVPMEGRMHDKKLETKPVGYFRDAMNRFRKNKGSVVAAWIILILVLYAIFIPIFCETPYSLSLTDTMYLNYAKLPPKVSFLSWLGMDGTSVTSILFSSSTIRSRDRMASRSRFLRMDSRDSGTIVKVSSGVLRREAKRMARSIRFSTRSACSLGENAWHWGHWHTGALSSNQR